MTKYEYKQETVVEIMRANGLSNRRFCRLVGLNRGDFYRFMYQKKELSEKNKQKIHAYAQSIGLDILGKKSIWKRIVDFIKG